jgi:hypothetical protein
MSFVAVGEYTSVGRYAACGEYTSMGEFTYKGHTVDYYAKAGSLSFADRNLKAFYEKVRNADIEFQKNLKFILDTVKPVFSVVEAASGGQIRASDVRQAFNIRLPSWGVALVLEVAAGKRPLDDAFKAVMRQAAIDMRTLKAAFAVITGVNGVLAVAGVPPSPAAPVLGPAIPVTATLAGLGATATTVALILEPIFDAIGKGKSPTRAQTKAMLEGAASLSGQKAPSSAEIDKVYSDLDKSVKASSETSAAFEAANRAKAEAEARAAASSTPAPTRTAPAATGSRTGGKTSFVSTPPPPARTAPSATPARTGTNLLPIAAGVGALALVGVMLARRK